MKLTNYFPQKLSGEFFFYYFFKDSYIGRHIRELKILVKTNILKKTWYISNLLIFFRPLQHTGICTSLMIKNMDIYDTCFAKLYNYK
jgi:hypothetical protein